MCWPSLPWVSALSLMSAVVADSIPVRGLVSVVAVDARSTLIHRLSVVTGTHRKSPARKGHQCSTSATPGAPPPRSPSPRPCSRRAVAAPATSRASAAAVERRHDADSGRLRRARSRAGARSSRRSPRPQEGKGVAVTTSYGASGDQSRAVVDGKPADVVNFSVEPDITRLVKAGQGRQGLERRRDQGHPVRLGRHDRGPQGQPEEHPGLGRPAAARASRSSPRARSAPARRSGTCWRRTPPRATAARTSRPVSTTSTSWSAEHVKTAARLGPRGDRRRSCRAPATCCSATRTRRSTSSGRASPSSTSTRRRRSRSRTRSRSSPRARTWRRPTALKNFLYTPEGQKIWARPASARSTRPSPRSSRTTSRRRRSCGRSPTSVAGATVDPTLFDKDNGTITKIYKQATG